MTSPAAALPLAGVRILDMSWLGVGCIATWILAALGAEVIKVEPADGSDNLRNLQPKHRGAPVVHLVFDRGKKSLAIDLKTEAGRTAYRAVARTADAVIDGMRPGVADKMGIGFNALRAEQPAITYVSMSGFGSGGPLSNMAGHDINFAAQAGILSLVWPGPAGPPPVQAADYFGALLGALATVSGVMGARATGKGGFVETSLFDGALLSVVIPMAESLLFKREFTPRGSMLIGAWACYAVYDCRGGGQLSVGALEPRFWQRFCALIGIDPGDQYVPAAQADLRARIAAILSTRSRDDWCALFDGEDVCVAPVLSVSEAAAQAQVRARGSLETVAHPAGGEVELPAPPIRLGPSDGPARLPVLGDHTQILLAQAGLSAAEIDALATNGIVAIGVAA